MRTRRVQPAQPNELTLVSQGVLNHRLECIHVTKKDRSRALSRDPAPKSRSRSYSAGNQSFLLSSAASNRSGPWSSGALLVFKT
jgi:hypothetical protein